MNIIVNSHYKYSTLSTKERCNKLITFRVPEDFPISSTEVKILIEEFNLETNDKPTKSSKIKSKLVKYLIVKETEIKIKHDNKRNDII